MGKPTVEQPLDFHAQLTKAENDLKFLAESWFRNREILIEALQAKGHPSSGIVVPWDRKLEPWRKK